MLIACRECREVEGLGGLDSADIYRFLEKMVVDGMKQWAWNKYTDYKKPYSTVNITYSL